MYLVSCPFSREWICPPLSRLESTIEKLQTSLLLLPLHSSITLFPFHFSQGVYISNQFFSNTIKPVAWNFSPPSWGIQIFKFVWFPLASWHVHMCTCTRMHIYIYRCTRHISDNNHVYNLTISTFEQQARKWRVTSSYSFFSSSLVKASNSTLGKKKVQLTQKWYVF